VAYSVHVEPVAALIRDVDWKSLMFLAAIFTLVHAIIKTELLQSLSVQLYMWFGDDVMSMAFCPWEVSRSCRACWPTSRWWRPPW
jgi:Na+/H+ antiporter NhaD/arsenite permease-like protein